MKILLRCLFCIQLSHSFHDASLWTEKKGVFLYLLYTAFTSWPWASESMLDPTEWCMLFCVFHIPVFWVGSYSAFSVLLQPLTDLLYWALCCVDSCKRSGFCCSLCQCFVFSTLEFVLQVCVDTAKGSLFSNFCHLHSIFSQANQHMHILDCGSMFIQQQKLMMAVMGILSQTLCFCCKYSKLSVKCPWQGGWNCS